MSNRWRPCIATLALLLTDKFGRRPVVGFDNVANRMNNFDHAHGRASGELISETLNLYSDLNFLSHDEVINDGLVGLDPRVRRIGCISKRNFRDAEVIVWAASARGCFS